jgi:hypothetical protein
VFCTYQYLRKDGTPYYVGKGNETRPYSKWRNVARPQEDARILVQFWESEEKAFEMEKWWIAFWGRKDNGTGTLRNLTDGGDGPSGLIHSEETKQRISKSKMNPPEETRAKIRAARAKQVITPNHKAAIKAGCLVGCKGNRFSEAARLAGRVQSFTEEWRRKQSDSHKGKPWSAARRAAQEARVSIRASM